MMAKSVGSFISETVVNRESFASHLDVSCQKVKIVTNLLTKFNDTSICEPVDLRKKLYSYLKTNYKTTQVAFFYLIWDELPALVKMGIEKDSIQLDKLHKNWELFIKKYPDGEIPDPDPISILEDS